MKIERLKARLKVAAASKTVKPKELGYGAYLSKEEPVIMELEDYEYEEEEETLKPHVAFYISDSDEGVYIWSKEVPKKLVSLRDMNSFMVNVSTIFSKVSGAKYLPKLSNGETSFCFKHSGGYLTILVRD